MATPRLKRLFALAIVATCGLSVPSLAEEKLKHATDERDAVFVEPTSQWMIAAGGRIYDNWWDALDKKKPEGTHPSYPSNGQVKGANTFRCKECHGWDYRGKDGDYAKGSHATGIRGIRGAAGRDPQAIMKLLRAPVHGYTVEMLSDAELKRIATFVSSGQHDTKKVFDARSGKPKGNARRGAGIYQTTCAVCHGYDGRLLNWGSKEEPEYIGTAANKFPAEVLHKTRNSHPGVAMINLRAFPLQDSIDVLAYAQTLPVK